MFKVGDKFRVIKSICKLESFENKVGIIDTVTKIIVPDYGGRTEIYGTNETGPNLWFENEIEKVEDNQIGAKVKIHDECSIHYGDTGLVYLVDEEDHTVRVRFDDGYEGWYFIDDIEFIKEEEMKFKVGDKVKIIESDIPVSNMYGVVTEIDDLDNSLIRVKTDNGSYWWFLDYDIELVGESPEPVLTTGMVVEYIDGSKGIVLKNTDIEYQNDIALTFYPVKGSYSDIDNEFLTYDEFPNFTVKRIIKPYDVSEIFNYPESIEGEVIWERPNPEKEKLNQQISKLEQELKEAKKRLENM